MSEACELKFLHTLNVIYSASVVLKATDICLLLHQETMENFTVKKQLNVLFYSTVLSVHSSYPCKLKSTLETYLNPYQTMPRRYLNTCFVVV
jgi:hypothetical protein